MFKFPDNCVTEASREAYLLRRQEYLHEQSIPNEITGIAEITEAVRAASVAEMRPFLLAALKDSKEANYLEGKEPPYPASKEDWDGEKIVRHKDFNLANTGSVLHHARRVMAMNMTSPDIDKISIEVSKAREACLHDMFWDGDIGNG